MSRPARVLVVEDDDSIRETLVLALQDEGYDVLAAANGVAGFNLLRETTPDAILLDMKMPVMDGWEFARRYRELPGPKAPVVVLTAASNAAARSAEVSADAYLSKPFDLDALIELLGRMTRHSTV